MTNVWFRYGNFVVFNICKNKNKVYSTLQGVNLKYCNIPMNQGNKMQDLMCKVIGYKNQAWNIF